MIGTPTSYFGQSFPAISPYGGYAFSTHPFGVHAQQYGQPPQQVLQQLLQILPQQLQQLLHVIPQQLQQVHTIQQQQLQHLQQLLQIVPQQLYQLQQLVHHLPQQLFQQQSHNFQQPFGTSLTPQLAAFSGGFSPQATVPWGASGAGPGFQSVTPQTFGYGAQPGQVM